MSDDIFPAPSMTVDALIEELTRMRDVHDVGGLPVYDLHLLPLHVVVLHDPNGDRTEAYVTIEPQ